MGILADPLVNALCPVWVGCPMFVAVGLHDAR